MLQNGMVIGGMYQILREIGEGGTGIVYLGTHLRLQKPIIIKKTKDAAAARLDVRKEADILKQLHHSYLPQVYDFLQIGNDFYTVMEYITGNDLQYYLEHHIRCGEQDLFRWLRQLCEVLEYLHSQNPKILHSDIKPGNIMITQQGQACLIDFNVSLYEFNASDLTGISRSYAAPEQYLCALDVMGGNRPRIVPDERMDLYSLAAVFYHLMTGLKPDAEKGIPCPIMRLQLPYSDGLKSVIDRALQPDRRKRFSSAAQMQKALADTDRLDPAYRRLLYQQIIAAACSCALILAGIFLLVTGCHRLQRDRWLEAYDSFAELAEACDDEAVIEAGNEMFNDTLLQGYLRRNSVDEAKVLHAMGDACYRQEEYDEAADYYKDALDADASDADCFSDYIIALLRDGQTVDIEDLKDAYPDVDPDNAQILYPEAWQYYMQGEYSSALACAQEALDSTYDRSLRAHLYTLLEEIYTVLGDMAEAAASAVSAAAADDSAVYLRRAGAACYAAGEASADANTGKFWYETALSYYETLCSYSSPSYEDRMNLALVLRVLGEYERSSVCLQDMLEEEEYAKSYEIRMWICLNDIRMLGDAKEEYEQILEELQEMYEDCVYYYTRSGDYGEDENMDVLIESMENLQAYVQETG